MTDTKALITLARDTAEAGDFYRALAMTDEPLIENPNHIGWLCLAVFCLEKAGKLAIAYHLCKRLLELAPRDPSAWLNMVNLESRLWMTTAAVKSAKTGLQFARTPDEKLRLLINLGCIYVDTGKFEEGLRYLKEAAKIDPTADKVWSNMGFCSLAKGNWAEGWAQYRKGIGAGWRTKVQYKGEPEWDGTKGQRVVLYGEQGVGDQICFVSVVPDAAKDIDIILDTHPKLKNLFARSFPNVRVYGTHMAKEKPWRIEDRDFDASMAMGQLGEYYRTKEEDFPRVPYLVADEERALMWKSLWKQKKKPVIGIGWTGGIQRTGRQFRCAKLEDFLPMFRAIDAHWVSLEYQPTKEIDEFKEKYPEIDIKEYPHATLTDDYDDTAALVASLDAVVCVPTSAGHLAGALGVPMVWLKHAHPCWKVKSGLPFHPWSALVDWAGDWKATITNSIPEVKKCLTATAESAQFTSAMTPDSHSPTTVCGTRSSPTPLALSA
jgi:tetratricopeptide (TPR) repeat protein